MKKFLAFVFSLACCLCLLTGCLSSYVIGGGGAGTDGDDYGGNADGAFTVKLTCEGEAYTPTIPISATWYNGTSLISANFKGGVATTYGLDGDYKVTLSAIPEGYAYNPNVNVATNRKREVTIDLIPLTPYFGAGTNWGSGVCNFMREGTYCVTFTEAGQKICCTFRPMDKGTYIIESIANTTTNEVNPRLEDYGQNSAGWTPSSPYEVCKDGGAASAYTKNFKYSASIDGDCINFGLRCDSRVDYPVNVYFTIKYDSAYSRDPVYEMVAPKDIYDNDGNLKISPSPSGTFIKCGQEEGNTNHILSGSKFALGEDGYYHYKNGDTITPSIVYVDLSDFVDTKMVESASGTHETYLSLKVETYDYTLFIRGWAGLVSLYGTSANVPEKYQQYKDTGGYIDTVCTGKICAVNEELKNFLNAYSTFKRLFFDGLGSAEREGYNSSDEDQWLYFCGYYI